MPTMHFVLQIKRNDVAFRQDGWETAQSSISAYSIYSGGCRKPVLNRRTTDPVGWFSCEL